MTRETGLLRFIAGAAMPALLLAALGGCAPAGPVPPPAQPAPEQAPPATPPAVEIPAAGEPYDLEEEIPVESGSAGRVEEDIEPVRADTFRVEEPAQPAEDDRFDLGYRVQVFASGSLDAAREIQKKVMAGTGLAAYIEFEEGLYKVRAGDFSTREEASAARTALAQAYPDCWIVRTTVRTVR